MMNDPYLYPDSHVLRNLLNTTNGDALDTAEAELSSMNMMLLYASGFSAFNATCLLELHRILFADVYAWAGEPRTMNIQKREKVLAGRSVWYANADDILQDLTKAWRGIESVDWTSLDAKEFATQMALFAEHYGFYFDPDIISDSAGYMRDALVLSSIGDYAEYEHLERILINAVCTEP